MYTKPAHVLVWELGRRSWCQSRFYHFLAVTLTLLGLTSFVCK